MHELAIASPRSFDNSPEPQRIALADPLQEFRVNISHANGVTTVDVAGELDRSTGAELAPRLEAVITASVGDVTLDLALVTFLDAGGINVLVAADHRLSALYRRLTIRNPSASTRRTFTLAGTADMLDEQPLIAPIAAD